MATKTQTAETIFFAALEHSDTMARAAYLDQACGHDAKLRRRVEQLLAAHPDAVSFLKDPMFCRGAAADRSSFQEGPGTQIGPYKLLQQIGEGGFGVVYMADQLKPVRRKVALKIIKPGLDTRSVVARFEAERQALALMDHPNIAQVLDAGATETGRPYFVMDLVKGVPITEYCDKNHLDTRERLALFVNVCYAIQHAHQKGVIHRDLKPANIMVTLHDGKPVPKVIDFGVSKAISQQLTEKTLFTAYGQMVGTPQYMSPEQAEMSGLDVDTRTDIYSLGVLLYELLTGQTPLNAGRLRTAGYAEMQRMICEEEALKPSRRLSTLGDELTIIAKHRSVEPKKLRQLVRGDLDWIVMKSLDKERSRRYDSASRLADDIQHYLQDEAVEARPPSGLYRTRKLVQRNKATVIAVAVVLGALAAGIIGTAFGLVRARTAAVTASKEADRANRLFRESQLSEHRANLEAERYRRLFYQSDMKAAFQTWQSGSAGDAVALLKRHMPTDDREDLRRFEWYHLFALCQRFLTTPAIEGSSQVAYSPDGKRMAYGDGRKLKMFHVDTVHETELLELEAHVRAVAFSPDGKLLACSSNAGVILLLDMTFERPPKRLLHMDSEAGVNVTSLAFSPNGNVLASSGMQSGDVILWDIETGHALRSLPHGCPVTSVAFSKDGTTLASCDWKGMLNLWDAAGSYQRRFTTDAHSGPGTCLAFSPTADVIASSGVDGKVRLWSINKGYTLEPLAVLTGHVGSVRDLTFSSDGKMLASGGIDHAVKVWDVASQKEQDTFRGSAAVNSLSFAPDVSRLAVASPGVIRLWDMSHAATPDILTGPTGELCFSTFMSDGDTLISCGWDGMIRFWDTGTGQLRGEHRASEDAVFFVALSHDESTLATGGINRKIRLWNLQQKNNGLTLKDVATLEGHPGAIWELEFSANDETLISASNGASDQRNGSVRLWDLSSTKTIEPYRYERLVDGHVATLSPDGITIASGTADGTVRLIEIDTGREQILTNNAKGLWSLDFSPNGKQLAAAGNEVMLWDLVTGKQRTLEGHTGQVTQVEYLPPDGKTLVSTGYDGTVRLWNAATGEARFVFPSRCGGINSFSVSPDGRMIALCGRDATIRLLRAVGEEDVRAAGWFE